MATGMQPVKDTATHGASTQTMHICTRQSMPPLPHGAPPMTFMFSHRIRVVLQDSAAADHLAGAPTTRRASDACSDDTVTAAASATPSSVHCTPPLRRAHNGRGWNTPRPFHPPSASESDSPSCMVSHGESGLSPLPRSGDSGVPGPAARRVQSSAAASGDLPGLQYVATAPSTSRCAHPDAGPGFFSPEPFSLLSSAASLREGGAVEPGCGSSARDACMDTDAVVHICCANGAGASRTCQAESGHPRREEGFGHGAPARASIPEGTASRADGTSSHDDEGVRLAVAHMLARMDLARHTRRAAAAAAP